VNGNIWPVNGKLWPVNEKIWPVNEKIWPVNGKLGRLRIRADARRQVRKHLREAVPRIDQSKLIQRLCQPDLVPQLAPDLHGPAE
jgi:hypothetical protein